MKFCECGCGGEAPIATMTSRRDGVMKGERRRFIRGHVHKRSGPKYEVDLRTGCWIWQHGRTTEGYGQAWDGRRQTTAHRFMYEQAHGSVPDGTELDHLCRNTLCCNPAHLEPVPHEENVRRGRNVRLSAEDVATIRARAEAGEAKRDLAAEFGVSVVHLRAICRGAKWRRSVAAA
jgi:hypothetical protein